LGTQEADVSERFDWHLPVSVRFGEGVADVALKDAADRDVVVITYLGASNKPALRHWVDAWSSCVSQWVELPEGLPTPETVRQVAAQVWPRLRAARAPLLVAIGGGAVMDVAKWVRCIPPDRLPQSLDALLNLQVLPRGWQRHELWLLPTTAGTGSEVTRWSTLWDLSAPLPSKLSFDQIYGYAERAYVDPQLTLTCPVAVTRDSALDALGHSLEVLWSRHSNPVSRSLALSAARRVIQHLPTVLGEPLQVQARGQLSLAALEAGIAFSQTRTALAHAASYDLTLSRGISHGAAVAVWLPEVWSLACGRDAQADAALAGVFHSPALEGPQRLRRWLDEVGFDLTLGALGIADPKGVLTAALQQPRGRNFLEAAGG
jgi:hypothetical protein